MNRSGGTTTALLAIIGALAIFVLVMHFVKDTTTPLGETYRLDNGVEAQLIERIDLSRDIGSPTLRLQWRSSEGRTFKAWFKPSEVQRISK